MNIKIGKFFGIVLLILVLTPWYTPIVSADSSGLEIVATNLNNPRGLDFDPDGRLYVAEAGSGGNGVCAPGPFGVQRCFGMSGSITRIDVKRGTQVRIATGFPSLASAIDQGNAWGVSDISFRGREIAYLAIGYGGDPNARSNFGTGAELLAQLGRFHRNGEWQVVSDLGAYEAQFNPNAGDPSGDKTESNPYSVLALPGKQIVADAAGNDLLEIKDTDKIKVLAVFPPHAYINAAGNLAYYQSVPDTVTLGPDGYYYVGELTGAPFLVGGANVYRVPPTGGNPELVASGFTHIIDLTFDSKGNLYILELAKNGLAYANSTGDWTGALIRLSPDGTQTEIASGLLDAPGGVTIGPDKALYVTNKSNKNGVGEVVRIEIVR